MDSGSGSVAGSGLAAVGVAAFEVEAGGGAGAPKVGFGGEGIAWFRTAVSAGGSVVEEAISSRREVAASSLSPR
jgi:hypothetical protein